MIVTRSPPAVENENRRFATFNPDRWTLAFVAIETATTPESVQCLKMFFFTRESRVTLLFRVVCIFCAEIVMEIYGAKGLFE